MTSPQTNSPATFSTIHRVLFWPAASQAHVGRMAASIRAHSDTASATSERSRKPRPNTIDKTKVHPYGSR